MNEYGVGTKALIDTFGGMVPCVVLEVHERAEGHIVAAGEQQLTVRVTKTMAGYKKGEILRRNAFYTPPTKQRRSRGFKHIILTNYVYLTCT